VPATWRRGDLIELRRTASRPAARPDLEEAEAWQEVIVTGARIRFRLDKPDQHAPADRA
jgi:hypothetical protein